jgi:diaminopimelate epimerase
MKLQFTKMQSLGNDFIVIDSRHQPFAISAEKIKSLAQRHYGIGFDQMLVLENTLDTQADFGYRIFNASGAEVAQCGNGARCLFAYIMAKKISTKPAIHLKTANRTLHLFHQQNAIGVDLGEPNFTAAAIPIRLTAKNLYYQLPYPSLDQAPPQQTLTFMALSVGNPHAIIGVSDLDTAPVATLGPALQAADCFPESVNVGFMQILTEDRIKLRVFERGAGETLACGSGAAAAVAAGICSGQLSHRVTVHAQGGDCQVQWAGPGHSLTLVGDAELVFEGWIENE